MKYVEHLIKYLHSVPWTELGISILLFLLRGEGEVGARDWTRRWSWGVYTNICSILTLHTSIEQVGRGKTTSCLRIQKEWLRQILKTSVCGRHTLPLAANCVAKGGQCVLPFWWTRHSSATCVASCCTPLGKININHPGNYPSELIQRQSDGLRNLLSEGKHFAEADLQSATLFVCLYFWAVGVSKMISLFTENAHTIEYSSNYNPTLRASRHYSRFVLGRFQVQISA
jgi:hypothetical protein